jgi:hypothetical protein
MSTLARFLGLSSFRLLQQIGTKPTGPAGPAANGTVSTVVKNGRIVYYEWHYTPEFNAQLEQACLGKPDYMFGRTRCLDFATQA